MVTHPEPAGVILLGGTHGALSAARSFGRNDIPVLVVADDHSLLRFSRYVERSLKWPGPSSPLAGKWLVDLSMQYNLMNWLLIPCADAEVKCVAENLVDLRCVYRVVCSDWASLRKVCDKQLLPKTAAAAGVAFPKSYRICSADAAATVDVDFPVVIKPSVRLQRNALTISKAWRANSREELIKLYNEAVLLVGSEAVVVQDLIPGGGEAQFSYTALWYMDGPVAEMTARRTRQYPIEFGHTSSFVEVIDNDAVKTAARKLLCSIGYVGLVEIEFKFDRRDSEYKVLDVNPRPWSWFALCEAAGLDYPMLMRKIALGEAIDGVTVRGGQAWIHLSKDIFAAVQLFARGELTGINYIRSLCQQLSFAAFAWDDPLPGILELPLFVMHKISRKPQSIFFSQSTASRKRGIQPATKSVP